MTDELIETFAARDEAGATYTLHVYQEYTVGKSLDRTSYKVPTLKRVEADDGRPVHVLDDGRYEILDRDGYAITVIRI